MRFDTTIELGGKTATGFRVPVEIITALGAGKRPPVNVTIAGHSYRSTVAVYGDEFFLPLSAENRNAAGRAAGDEVDVDVELDTEPREVSVPNDFAKALAGDTAAKRQFESLSYSNKRRHVLAIEEAKTPETRQRRIVRTIDLLRTGGK